MYYIFRENLMRTGVVFDNDKYADITNIKILWIKLMQILSVEPNTLSLASFEGPSFKTTVNGAKYLLQQTISLQIFLKAVFHKFYLVHS